MGIGWIFAVLFALLALGLLIWILSMRSSMREMADELDEKLRTDTNTLISISSGDRAIRALAARLNVQLCALRKERLRLQNGDAALKTAIANVSHDLRTPLTAICGYLELLESQMAPEKQARYLAVIRERTDAMRAMIDELLQYSMIASAEETLKCEPVCLNAALEQSLVGLYGAFTARGIVPDVRIPEKRIMAKIDPDAIRRVLDNVLGNAAKYSDGDLKVTLETDGAIIFENAAEKLGRVQAEKLFDRFYTVQTASGSTGLGLSIAKALTERMGGSICAEYENGMLRVRIQNFPK